MCGPLQDECQNRAVAPSPMVTVGTALKRVVSMALHGGSVPTHARSGSVQEVQSHRNLRARLNRSRSRMPSPPCDVGAHTAVQLTLQLPPVISSSCFHKNLRLHLSISFSNFFGTRRTVKANVGMALRTHRTSTRLLANGSSFPFHPARRALILSMMNYRFASRSLASVSGRPR